jgi:hypothetical protein
MMDAKGQEELDLLRMIDETRYTMASLQHQLEVLRRTKIKATIDETSEDPRILLKG